MKIPVGHLGRHAWRDGVRPFFAAAADLVFPPSCLVCETSQCDSKRGLICSDCRHALVDRQSVRCEQCGSMLPLGDYGQQLCPSCPRQPHRIDRTLVLGDYRGVLRETILRMKRAHHEALTFAVGGLLAERVEETGFADDIDLIVPLPSHWRRRFRRWFNIAELLACPVARRSRLALAKNLLKYQRLPDKQGTLTRLQRFVNMRAAMSAKRGYFLSGRAVLLVDDVTTSGATAREAARVCRQAGAGRVKLAVVARGKDA